MKKQLSSTNSESGFIFPYVLLIATVLFIVITANINMYRQEIQLTYQTIDQLKVETLLQMGYAKFLEEFSKEDLDQKITVQYDFPDGNVTIEFNQVTSDEGQLLFQMNTKNNSYVAVTKPIHLSLK